MELTIKGAKVDLELSPTEAANLIAQLATALAGAPKAKGRNVMEMCAMSVGCPAITMHENGNFKGAPGLFNVVLRLDQV